MVSTEQLTAALAGRYTIEAKIATGGMATVYRARDLRHDRVVAVKVLKPELAAAVGFERFQAEIGLTARLQHPHILPLFDSGEVSSGYAPGPGLLYYVMPHVEGETLRARIERERQLPIEDALEITRAVGSALEYAHKHSVLHRDLKPENILLHEGEPLVADFGLALALGDARERLTQSGVTVGTPQYMSPEQAVGDRQLDERSDLYSLGAVLYEMLAGEPPHTGPSVHSVISKVIAERPTPLRTLRDTVPDHVSDAIDRVLAKAPADRFASVNDFVRALDQDAVRTRWRLPVRPRRAAWIVGTAVVATGLGVLFYRGAGQPQPTEPRWVVIADFEPTSRDPTIGLVVKDVAAAEIDASRTLRAIGSDQVANARVKAQIPDTGFLTVERARHIAYRTSVGIVIGGRVDRIAGERYSVTVRAVDASDGRTLASLSGDAGTDELIATARRITRGLVRELGDRGNAWFARPLRDDASTSSFEAYKHWVQGRDAHLRGEWQRAVGSYREALRADSGFAIVWLRLATAYGNMGMSDSTRSARQAALRHADRLSEGERLMLVSDTLSAIGDLARSLRVIEEILQKDRYSASAYNGHGTTLMQLGRYEDGIESLRRAVDLMALSPAPQYVANLAANLASVGRVAGAESVFARVEPPFVDVIGYQIAAARGELARAESLAVRVEREPTQVLSRRTLAALTTAAVQTQQGRVADGRATLSRAATLSGDLQTVFSAGSTGYSRTLSEVLLAAASGADLDRCSAGRSDDQSRLNVLATGICAAWRGDTATAHRSTRALAAANLAASHPIRADVPLVAGSLAAVQGRWADVVATVGPSAHAGVPGPNGGGVTLRRWLVADAYERLGRSDSAAVYFRFLVDSPKQQFGHFPQAMLVKSFAHRRLALIYEQLGRGDDARQQWERFLEAFTRPDPEYRPMVRDARQRLARLR